MPCKPSSVSMMQIEQSALGTWKVALYHWRSGSWARESESVRISVIFIGILWRKFNYACLKFISLRACIKGPLTFCVNTAPAALFPCRPQGAPIS